MAAGTTGDGGLFVQKARDQPRCVQKFINWSPVTDSVIVSSGQDSSSSDTARDRLFVCSASSYGRGAIFELRHGLEAQIGLVVSLEDLSSTRDIWTMSDDINGGVYLLISDPVSSILLYLSADFGEEMCAIDEADSGLDFSTQTLAAGCTSSGVLVQITEKAILLGTTTKSTMRARFEFGSDQSVAVAAVHSSASLIASAVRTRHEMHLSLKSINIGQDQLHLSEIGQPLRLPHEPVSILIEVLGTFTLIFVGTGNGKVLIYSFEDSTMLLSEVSIDVENGDDLSKAIESLAVVAIDTDGPSQKYTILCGLRSGIFAPFEMTLGHGNTKCAIGTLNLTLNLRASLIGVFSLCRGQTSEPTTNWEYFCQDTK